jgi:hypothetical protein
MSMYAISVCFGFLPYSTRHPRSMWLEVYADERPEEQKRDYVSPSESEG